MSENTVACYKFTLPNKREVTLREPKIADTRAAAQVAGKKAVGNQLAQGVLIQEELVKLLLVAIDGKPLAANEKESLDRLFSVKEYSWVLKAVEKITEDDTEGELQMEIETSGPQ